MEPVINPWVFYLIDGADTLKWGALLFGTVIGLILLFIGASDVDEAVSDEEEKSGKKKMKTEITMFIIGAVLFVFLPSSETAMKMAIAKNVTGVSEQVQRPRYIHCKQSYADRRRNCKDYK